MRVGAIFPQTEIGNDPAVIARYTRMVEELGYDHLVVYDHVLGAHPDRPGGWTGPYTHATPFHELFVLFGYMAAITTRLELAAGVLVLPQRQTALVAKQAAEVDVLSRGRLRLGVGIGWNEVEFEALGMRFKDRGRRIEEQIDLLRKLWTEDVLSYDGRWHKVDRAGLNPMPVQRPVPVWMGGNVEPAVKRIARIADGWFSFLRPDDEGRERLQLFRQWVSEAGRDPDQVGVEGRVLFAKRTHDEWVRLAEAFRAMAVSHLEVSTMGAGYTTVDDHLDALRRFREAVPPGF